MKSDYTWNQINIPLLGEAAFFLDFDGTLVDIAPTPDSVKVERGLTETLQILRRLLGNALAVVTGRPIGQIDHFLPHIPYAVAGEHGGALRFSPEGPIQNGSLPSIPQRWLEEAENFAQHHEGVIVEKKNNGFVLHFRKVPELENRLHKMAEEWVGHQPDSFELQSAKMAWEIRPKGVDKGQAVYTLMEQPPFRGRKPVFIGDDITDEDGIKAAQALGGVGYRIPHDFPDSGTVRVWLKSLVEGAEK
ncbi:trehalose-phosphatase [Entomobacter blattae]|nr:trehalose-phosphatase [Entomobacter blattae]